MTDKIRAPWTPEQVAALNEFQRRGGMHPFTCGNDHATPALHLVAHEDGWHCWLPDCDYRQDWAHAFMANPNAWPQTALSAPRSVPQTSGGLADGQDAHDGAEGTQGGPAELTAEEARALTDELGTDLYRAQDALEFVAECCVIADREQRPITTATVREWLKGAQCGRQLAADNPRLYNRIAAMFGRPHPRPTSEVDPADPDTVTDPAWLRGQYAAAIWERQNPGRHYADCEYRWQADAEADADAVLAVRDRDLRVLADEVTRLSAITGQLRALADRWQTTVRTGEQHPAAAAILSIIDSDGPTVQECTQADRLWPLQREGE